MCERRYRVVRCSSLSRPYHTQGETNLSELSICYHLPACYLDMARAMLAPVKGDRGIDTKDPVVVERCNNVVLAAVLTSIMNSYQALEAFCNSQLHEIWIERDSETPSAKRLEKAFPRATTYEDLKQEKLGDKIKGLARALDILPPPSTIDRTWNEFKQVVETSRRFAAHPNPETFSDEVKTIMQETQAGTYVRVAETILRHFFVQTDRPVPRWIDGPTYFKGLGFQLLLEE